MKYVGIDLGTTYSCISVMDEISSKPSVIEIGGASTVPSVVWFRDDGTSVVGSLAKRKVRSDNAATVELAKRFMGTDKEWNIYGKKYTPVNISAIILKELFGAYKAQTSEECKVVVTCPANYTPLQKELVKEAAKEAGIGEIRLLNEPTAAAISYSADSGKNSGGILVYDLGGGTLDVTALYYDKEAGLYEVMASDGKADLGGADWDAVVEEEIYRQLSENGGRSVDELKNDIKVFPQVIYESEQIKKSLSSGDFEDDIFMGPEDCCFTYSKKNRFEGDTKGLLDSSLDLFQSVLDTVKRNADQHPGINFTVDAVVLVGGSSNMPQVKEGIIAKYPEFNGKIWLHDPDRAISFGATYYAKIKQDPILRGYKPESNPNKPEFNEVLSTTFGIDSYCDNVLVCFNLLFKNDKIPKRITREFYTHAACDAVICNIFMNGCKDPVTQNICPLDECQALANFNILLPTKVDAGEPVLITFVVEEDGTIHCEGTCRGVTSIARISPSDIKKNLTKSL